MNRRLDGIGKYLRQVKAMKKCFLFVISLSVAGAAFAEIDDETAKARALEYAARIGYTSERQLFIVFRESNPPSILVTIDERVNVFLRTDGSFRNYSNPRLKTDRSGSPDLLSDDETSWRAAEAVLAKFELPDGLERHRIVRQESTDYIPATVHCFFNARPFGYQSWAGNTARVLLDQSDGTPIEVSISSGWTYEPPNIRVSQQQAIAKAQDVYGGSIEDWHVELMYLKGSNRGMPEYMREMAANKIQRLWYSASRDSQDTTYLVLIDSVTGHVFPYGTTGSTQKPNATYSNESPRAESQKKPPTGDKNRSSGLLPYSIVAFVVAFGGFAVWMMLRSRAKA